MTSGEPDAQRWVVARAAAIGLFLDEEDLPGVVGLAETFVPMIARWRQDLGRDDPLPFPISGRLREPSAGCPGDSGLQRRVHVLDAPRDRFQSLVARCGTDPAPADAPLAGLDFTVKANIDVAGLATTSGGSTEVTRPPATRSAPIVDALLGAGASCVGIANLGELALDATSDNPWHGRVANPVDVERTPGGSSGGSAASIAAGLAPLSLGSDSAGSVRIPAAFCEVVGYRPSPGRIPLKGLRGAAWSLDTIGFMADSMATIDRAARAIDVVRAVPGPGRPRVGVLEANDLGAVDPGVAASFADAVDQLGGVADCVRLRLPGLLDVPAVAAVIAYAEAAAQLGEVARRAPKALGRPAREIVQFGMLLSADDYLVTQRVRSSLLNRWLELVEGVDLVATPTVPMVPFHFGTSPSIPGDDAGLAIFAFIRFTALANVFALPAVSVPSARSGGLPVGLQLTGTNDGDDHLIAWARLIEGAIGTSAGPGC
ncbi:MAG: aspartyl-tRNA(Asn)/glutamyl-tRNA(Gln) amidotransferase subunit [Actinomycetia bacterium]|nr:aspartyl-tRNA(Asn)/glutamyl-tRNA(Gln) amidotransferase subunit [Actinomycetes bacterium]